MDISFKDGSGIVSVNDEVFDATFNESLIHQVVISYLAGGRVGSKSQKTRAEVSGGGVKPWKQKGSGRARAGTIRSPLWRGGGMTFAARPCEFLKKVNRKMYRGALRSIFSELYRQKRMHLIEDFKISSCKTKDFIKYINSLGLKGDFLMITESLNKNIFFASRNIPDVSVIDVDELNPVSLLQFKNVVIDRVSVERINGWLS